MEIILDRDVRSAKSTMGKIYVDGAFQCFCLEDEDRGLKNTMPLSEISERKIQGKTCIPEGTYKVIVTRSERFGRDLPLLVSVPGYDGIRIHPGNTDVDTEGCILPGEARTVDAVINSRKAFDALFGKITAAIQNSQSVFITIKQ